MRRQNCLLASLALTAGLLVVVPSEAQQGGTAGTATGLGSPSGQFFSGFMPSNLTVASKPLDLSGATKPLSFQNTMMPQQQSTKVLNINSAFRGMTSTYFKSTIPTTPVVRPGVNNPLQPTKAVQLPTPKPSSKLFGFIPWF